MRRIFLMCGVMVFWAMAAVVFAQQGTVSSLKGRITDQENKPLAFANVGLYRSDDSTLVKVSVAEEDGSFEFEKLVPRSYYLLVSYVGYRRYKSAPLMLSAGELLTLPDIALMPEEALKEVVVTYTKPFVERQIDRTVINPDALIGNAGTNALEVLEKSPGVQVEPDGAIRLKGKGGVVIFVDDKPTYLSADALANYLRSLPSSSIESIELMTNPPAKYDAAGNAGVINIRLKKTITKGLNGGFNLSAGQGFYTRTNHSANLNYRIEKVNLFANVSYVNDNSYQDLTIERNYLGADGRARAHFRQNTFIRRQTESGSARLGLDFYMTKTTTAGFVVNGLHNISINDAPNRASMQNSSGQIDSLINTTSFNQTKLRNGAANLNFAHKFARAGSELTANMDLIRYDFEARQDLENAAFFADGRLKTRDQLDGRLPSGIVIRTLKADYVHPLKKGGNIEAGAKSSQVSTTNIANFANVRDGISTPSRELTNSFDYKENIHAASVNLRKEFGRLTIQQGLRVENTHINGLQYGNLNGRKDSTFQNTYTNLFPTVYLAYKLDTTDTHQVGFSYGRRIERPNYQDMNPFSYPLDRFTIYAGNPFLQPTFSHNFELTHTFKNQITTTLGYSRINNMIAESIEISNNIFYSRPNNIGKQTNITLSLNGVWQPAKWWTIPFYVEANNMHFQTVIYGQELSNRGTYYNFNITNQFQMGKGWSSELNGTYQSSIYYAQFITKAFGRVRVGIQKKLLKNQATLKMVLNDAFWTVRPGGDILALDNATANYHSVLDSRVVTCSFAWRFSKGQALQGRRSGGSETEQNRVKT